MKVGDTVVCINNDGQEHLIIGKKYKIIDEENGFLTVNTVGYNTQYPYTHYYLLMSRFKLDIRVERKQKLNKILGYECR